MMYAGVLLMAASAALVNAETIHVSQVFVIPIGPELFDWSVDANHSEFSYQASLLNAPDLPPWIHYTYSQKHRRGFLYGAAPKHQLDFQLEIVGLNKHTYDTSYKVLDMKVREKENFTKYEVQIKIDNLNVEDTFEPQTMEGLLDIFRNVLWVEARDVYLTFLASAVELGARLPLKPEEPEGVVLRLGSTVPFSHELNDIQEETKPLWRRSPCPRDFKKTSRERNFRKVGFILDWCFFRLIEENRISHQESARRGPSMNVISRPSAGISGHAEWHWARPNKADMPTRSYMKEIATTVFIPAALLLILAGLLSTALCLHHEKMYYCTRWTLTISVLLLCFSIHYIGFLLKLNGELICEHVVYNVSVRRGNPHQSKVWATTAFRWFNTRPPSGELCDLCRPNQRARAILCYGVPDLLENVVIRTFVRIPHRTPVRAISQVCELISDYTRSQPRRGFAEESQFGESQMHDT